VIQPPSAQSRFPRSTFATSPTTDTAVRRDGMNRRKKDSRSTQASGPVNGTP